MTTVDSSRVFAVAILLMLLAVNVTAQTSATDGKTPSGLAPGAPAGSYPLTDIENINLFSGNLNFALPLLSVGGRGAAKYTMTLPIEQHWRTYSGFFDLGGGNLLYYSAPEANWWTGLKPGYGPGVVQGRHVADGPLNCPGTEWYSTGMSRITFTAPNGTEYELVDRDYGGRPLQAPGCYVPTTSRGTVFYSNTGAGLTFISDFPVIDYNSGTGPLIWEASGYLKFPDGTTYRVVEGLVTSIRDANGNTLTFSYGTNPSDPLTYKRLLSVTDPLKRQISITYANNVSVFYDQITFKGFSAASRTMKVWYNTLGNRMRTTQPSDATVPWTSSQLFPELSPNNQPYNPTVVSSLELPDGRTYQFYYNQYSELARVVLPTGGAYEYDHTPTSGVLCQGLCEGSAQIYRRTTEKRSYPNGTTLESTIKFSAQSIAPNSKITVDNVAPNGTLLSRAKHYFHGDAGPSFFLPSLFLPPWREAKEYMTEFTSADGVTVLKRINQTWKQRASVTWWPLSWQGTSQEDAPVNDPRLVETITTLVDTNQMSKVTAINPQTQEVGFDQFNNQTDVWVFEYGAGAVGNLVRHMHTDFLTVHPTNQVDYTNRALVSSPHLLRLPVEVMIFDAGGIKRADSKFEYDNYNNSPSDNFHAPLKDWPALTGHPISGMDPAFTTSYTTRGNRTAITRFLLNDQGTTTGQIDEYTQYDLAGNAVKTIDPRSTQTNVIASTIDFTDRFGGPNGEARNNNGPSELSGSPTLYTYAFPTLITNALGHTIYSQFDFYLGRPVDVEDANGIVSSSSFSDSLDRPTQLIRGVNGGATVKSQITIAYSDADHLITTSSDQVSLNDNVIKSQILYDGFGRTIEERQFESSTQYTAITKTPVIFLQDPDNSAWLGASRYSNPYRPLNGEQPKWNTSFSDSLGRVIKVRTPDDAIIRRAYSGPNETTTDQAGKVRQMISDSLGRVIKVYEAPNSLNYLTIYDYDVLDDLVKVTQTDPVSQYTQLRTFTYDSLKRLKAETRPETGNISYDHDNAGNVTLRVDPRLLPGTQTHLTVVSEYDALNRPKTRTYNDGTPTVTYSYDSATINNGIGRMSSVSSSVSTYSFNGYDAMGRVNSASQVLGSKTYTMSYVYDLAGHVTSLVYPSLRSVTYNYDQAGRLADKDSSNLAFTGTLGDGNPRNYSTGILYSPFGGIAKEKFGTTTALYNKLLYNIRGQLAEIRLGTTYSGPSDTSWNRGAIINNYSNAAGCSGASCSATDNNGNLMKQEYWIPKEDVAQPTQSVVVTQQFEYDALNRIDRVFEGSTWQQKFTYDRFGNRTINQNVTSPGIPKPNFGVDVVTNRLTAPAGATMTYDAAGNLTFDNSYNSKGDRVFDADNHMTSAKGGVSASWQYYVYDGQGRRVKRTINGVETWHVYGLNGELLAEYAANASNLSPLREYGYRNGQLLVTTTAGTAGAPAPSNLEATPPTSGSSITLNWQPASGATNYRVERKPKNGSFTSIGTTSSTSLIDSGATSGNAYLYKVCAANSAGTCTSGFSNIALGCAVTYPTDPTIKTFSEDPANATLIKAAHITELRSAVNAVRQLAGIGDATWTNSVLTIQVTEIKADDVRDLRARLDEALVALGIQTSAYTDTPLKSYFDDPLNAPLIKAIHIRQLRLRATSGIGGSGGGGGTTFSINWLVTDQNGTPRMILNEAGGFDNVVRHDYLPFGEELFASARTTANGYTNNDGMRQRFTAYERDDETELDFAQARYYSNVQGRFTGIDPYGGSAVLANPQSWNRYTYCINDPVNYIDPTGLVWVHDLELNLYVWVPDADYKSGNSYFDNQDRYSALTQDEIGPNGVTFTVNELVGSWNTPENQALLGQEVYLGADGKAHPLYPPLEGNKLPQSEVDRINTHNLEAIRDILGASQDEFGRFIPNPSLSLNSVTKSVEENGFTWYADGHPHHWGGWDYEGQVNGTWYHVVIGYHVPYYERDTKPPTYLQAFPQRFFYRPSGMHRIDWLTFGYDGMGGFR